MREGVAGVPARQTGRSDATLKTPGKPSATAKLPLAFSSTGALPTATPCRLRRWPARVDCGSVLALPTAAPLPRANAGLAVGKSLSAKAGGGGNVVRQPVSDPAAPRRAQKGTASRSSSKSTPLRRHSAPRRAQKGTASRERGRLYAVGAFFWLLRARSSDGTAHSPAASHPPLPLRPLQVAIHCAPPAAA